MTDTELHRMIWAFERHFDASWDCPELRSERLSWQAAWKAARGL